MASQKFQRKLGELAAKVMDDGEQFVAGVPGQAGMGAVSKLGVASSPLRSEARLAATVAGRMFPAWAIRTDRNVYVIRTPLTKGWEVQEVVLKRPVDDAEVELAGKSRLRIDDYYLTYTFRVRNEAKRFAEAAAQTAD